MTGGRVFAVDSNIDDVGFTFRPLGNSRVVVYELDGAPVREVELQGGLQAIDAVLSGGSLVVLNQGTLGPSFQPDGNGSLFVLDPASLQVAGPFELEGNGVSIEAGADGRVYVTVTNDFASIQSLRFDPAVPGFVDGPDSPIQVRDASGGPISCWTVTALGDGRLICATFRSEEAGDLYLLSSDGAFIDSTPGGFGTTDLEIVVP